MTLVAFQDYLFFTLSLPCDSESSSVVNMRSFHKSLLSIKIKSPPASLLNQQQQLIKHKYIKKSGKKRREEKDDGTGFVWLKQFIV